MFALLSIANSPRFVEPVPQYVSEPLPIVVNAPVEGLTLYNVPLA
jgi:hypothetical protein